MPTASSATSRWSSPPRPRPRSPSNASAAPAPRAAGDDVDWAFVDAANGNAILPVATLTFAPGVTTRNVRVRVKNDGMSEPGETAVLELRAPLLSSLSANLSKHTLWIFDGGIPTLATEERWSGGTVYTNQTWSGSTPDYTGYLAGFTTARDVAENYSRRITGLITAPATGSYTFWIASDDASRLYLSTTSSAANKVQIANITGYTNFQDWDANASQKSVAINLTAGQSYYMEVQHQEGGGGDHASVAWEGPGFTRKPIAFARSGRGSPQRPHGRGRFHPPRVRRRRALADGPARSPRGQHRGHRGLHRRRHRHRGCRLHAGSRHADLRTRRAGEALAARRSSPMRPVKRRKPSSSPSPIPPARRSWPRRATS